VGGGDTSCGTSGTSCEEVKWSGLITTSSSGALLYTSGDIVLCLSSRSGSGTLELPAAGGESRACDVAASDDCEPGSLVFSSTAASVPLADALGEESISGVRDGGVFDQRLDARHDLRVLELGRPLGSSGCDERGLTMFRILLRTVERAERRDALDVGEM
jgi:hypothetical protein